MKKYTGNFCTGCKKNLPDKNFSKKFSKFQNKFILLSKCKKCRNQNEKNRRKTDIWASNFERYNSVGHYGWTTGWENKLIRHVWRYIKENNIWEKKLNSIITVNSYEYMGSRSDNPLTKLQRKIKNIENTKKFMSKRKFKMNSYNVLGELMMMQCSSAFRNAFSILNRNIWEKKIDHLYKDSSRRRI